MYENHARAYIFHYRPDSFSVVRRVTVYLTFAATRLVVAFGTMVKSPAGIIQQILTIVAEVAIV